MNQLGLSIETQQLVATVRPHNTGTKEHFVIARKVAKFARDEPREGCRYFEATGQNVCGDMLTAWRTHGVELGDPGIAEGESLALFGRPISPLHEEAIEGQPYQVQWFERARFEYHTENAPPYTVLLGLLGSEWQDER